MVSLTEVRSANAALGQSHQSLSAVFVGATSGIGKATLQSFAKHIPKPTAFIVGRSRKAFESELANLKALNPNGEFTFLEVDVMLVKNIDVASKQIQDQLNGQKIDLLFTSQGYMSFNGREENEDGLDKSVSLRYYGRLRFAQNFLPSLSKNGRVVSILGGGKEGKVFEDDLDLRQHYSVGNAMSHFGTLMTLSFDKLAEQNPDKAFLHIFPCLVSTGLLGKSATGFFGVFMRFVLEPVINLFASKSANVGERMLYYAITDAYPKGSWALDWDGTAKEVKELKEYREKGLAAKVADHNEMIFEQALSR